MSYAQDQIKETVQTAQSLLKCRSTEEMNKVHTQFMQQSFDRLINGANKMTQKAAALARDKAQPLNAKVEEFMKRMNPAA